MSKEPVDRETPAQGFKEAQGGPETSTADAANPDAGRTSSEQGGDGASQTHDGERETPAEAFEAARKTD